MNLRGYNIDIKSIEDTAQEDFDKYNIIIAPNNWQYLNFYKTPITESKNKNYNCMYRRVDYKIVPPNLANDYTYTSLCKFTETFSEKYKFEEVTSFDDITEKCATYFMSIGAIYLIQIELIKLYRTYLRNEQYLLQVTVNLFEVQ